jgi:hypothetical protein
MKETPRRRITVTSSLWEISTDQLGNRGGGGDGGGGGSYSARPNLFYSRARICKRLFSPEIDSEESIQPAYVAWRAGTTNRVVVPARQAGNRFLGSFKGLQIRA